MALTQPILQAKSAFDASYSEDFSFQVIGGNQVTKNRLVIKNNQTLATVYDAIVDSFKLIHTVPAGTLENGVQYIAQVQTGAVEQGATIWSAFSANIIFYCYTTPVISLTNMPPGDIVNNSSFNFIAQYSQLEGERLNSYQFILYDFNGVQIASSGTVFPSGATVPTDINYSFSGFEDDSQYYLEVKGVTVNSTLVTTGRVLFSVDYIKPNVFTILNLENDCDNGWIKVSSNIVLIDGYSNPEPPIYINNEEVDVRGEGHFVGWKEGYSLKGDFTIGIWGRDLTPFKEVALLTDGMNSISVNWAKGYENPTDVYKCYAYINCKYGNHTYYCYSNYINEPAENEVSFIWIRRRNNVYELKIENKGVI